MIEKIIAISDVHFRNLRRQNEYVEVLTKFIDECKNIVNEYDDPSKVRIVVAGDLFHSKLDISCEAYALAYWFLHKLDEITTTIVIAGNHDLNENNLSRLDPLSLMFNICDFKHTFYLDKECGYESGTMEDDNIVWCLYSIFDSFARPNIDEARIEHPKSTFVGLYHGDVRSAKTDAGYISENGTEPSYFDNLDFAIMGHIHKSQCINFNGIKLVYCGSPIQQDYGENISSHGYVVWDVESATYQERTIENTNNGFYTFTINNIDDIENNKEEIINL